MTERKPYEVRVLESYGEGRGGIVSMPIARVTPGVILANTEGGGDGTVDIDEKLFDEVIKNFKFTSGPVPVYPGHLPSKDRKTTPAWGDVRGLWMEGEWLVGKVQLTPAGWKAVVEDRGFYGSSPELDLNPAVATGSIDGWMLTGLAVTNTPALDNYFAIMFSAVEGRKSLRLSMARPGVAVKGEKTMTEQITLEALQASNADLRAQLGRANEEVASLKAELAKRPTVEEFQTVKATLEKAVAETISAKVVSLVKDAINEGVVPAFFEGYESDPMKFLADRFGGSVTALEATCARLPRQKSRQEVGSGGNAEPDGNGDDKVGTFMAEVTRIATEQKISFGEAYDHIRKTKPELYTKAAQAAMSVRAKS